MTQTTPQSVAAKLTEDAQIVIQEMSGDIGYPAASLAAWTKLPIARVRKAQRELVGLGLAYFGPLINEDTGLLAGRGYCLEDRAYGVRTFLLEQNRG